MILLVAILAGLLVGWALAVLKRKTWQPPFFQTTSLVVWGFLPQLLAFYIPLTRQYFPDWLASLSLIVSQLTLLIFVLVNKRLAGMSFLMIGLVCNLVVILANGGFMPLPAEGAEKFIPAPVYSALEVGERISMASKDVLLPEAQIRLPWLADRFVSPPFSPLLFFFSLGDIFIALGAFWVLVQGNSALPQTN